MVICFSILNKKTQIYKSSTVVFGAESPAFITTNEDLRFAMKFMPKNCERALTVAASGDHPLWCSLYGAKHVDTFDITYNAKCIMDIKVAALGCIKCDEYAYLLKSLSKHSFLYAYLEKNTHLKKIVDKLPSEDLDHINENMHDVLFGINSGVVDKYRLPTNSEYEKLSKIVQKPYDFIHTDIANLGDKLTESYDFIHLSNIFEHMSSDADQEKIIMSLLKHVNVGGRILFQHLIYKPWKRPPIPEHLCQTHGDNDWRFIQTDMISILERCR